MRDVTVKDAILIQSIELMKWRKVSWLWYDDDHV